MITKKYEKLDRENFNVPLDDCTIIRMTLYNDIATQYKRKAKLVLKILAYAPREQELKTKVSHGDNRFYGEYGNIISHKKMIEEELRLIDDNLKDMLKDYAFLSLLYPDLLKTDLPKNTFFENGIDVSVIDGAINNFFTAPDWDFRYND